MKSVMTIAAVALMFAGTAFGVGTVTFTDVQNGVTAGTPVILNVTVSSTNPNGFDSLDLFLGWAQSKDVSFAFSSAFTTAMSGGSVFGPSYGNGVYTKDVYVGGANDNGSVGQSLLIGQLTLQTTGLADGTYPVLANGANSMLHLAGADELVNDGQGLARIITPEPASLMLLGLGAAATLRRRRA
jgi:hypothetical protein